MKFIICQRCGEKIKESNSAEHGQYHCKGWYIFLKNSNTIEIRDNFNKKRLVIDNIPNFDIEKARETVPITIDVKGCKTNVELSPTPEEPKEDEQI